MGVFEELTAKMETLQSMVQQLLDIQQQQAPVVPDTILDLEQAAEYTGYNHKYFYTVKDNIPHFKCGGKLKFKKSDLDEWMTRTRLLSRYERDAKAAAHVAAHPMKATFTNNK